MYVEDPLGDVRLLYDTYGITESAKTDSPDITTTWNLHQRARYVRYLGTTAVMKCRVLVSHYQWYAQAQAGTTTPSSICSAFRS
ncbi:hypothetical protein CSPX01_05565 [Colletotrichum filicis]|nr:hypothetical protein CSPX01_05565 [Colletotrichum filicis]